MVQSPHAKPSSPIIRIPQNPYLYNLLQTSFEFLSHIILVMTFQGVLTMTHILHASSIGSGAAGRPGAYGWLRQGNCAVEVRSHVAISLDTQYRYCRVSFERKALSKQPLPSNCMYINIYRYIYICILVCIYMYVYMHMYTHAYMHTYVYIHICKQICICVSGGCILATNPPVSSLCCTWVQRERCSLQAEAFGGHPCDRHTCIPTSHLLFDAQLGASKLAQPPGLNRC